MPVKMLMTACGSASDMIAVHGVDKDRFGDFRHYTVPAEALRAFRATANGALVGERIAARYGWRTGHNVSIAELGGIAFVVSGIFTTHGTAEDYTILTGRRFVQEAVNEQGISNYVLVSPRPGADLDGLAAAIDALPLTVQTETKAEQAHLAVALDQLRDLARAGRYVVGLVAMVILIAMGNAFSMMTRERTREFAVLRTLGFGKAAILGLVLGEGCLLAFGGGLAGCAAVQVLTSLGLVKTISSCSVTISLTAGPAVWAAATGAVTLAGGLGCLLPAWTCSRLPIVGALRRGD
jgi:putative ABC transport system permease protein